MLTKALTPAKHMLAVHALLLLFTLPLSAQTLTPPQDPTQSITYWKPHAIAAEHDAAVALIQQVFSVLLRTWDGSRVAPDLYVVQSSGGPWAASLADGNILLSRSAIDVCLSFGKQKAQHLLAFILSHELAHQRADDLWHHKFLRLAGSQAPQVQQKILNSLTIDADDINDLEQREAQADHTGLLIMASVGYDPFQIVDQKDFFTTWVENIWNISCGAQKHAAGVNSACIKAQSRALRARAQLVTVATQATLFELGVHAYVAGHYPKARQYFSAFGKDYPSRAVYLNLGLTYLRQALDIQDELLSLDNSAINFYYPLLLDGDVFYTPGNQGTKVTKRGDLRGAIQQLRNQRHQYVESAISHFEKAIRLEPAHRNSYLLLAMSYLLDENTFMIRGIIQGQYIPKFGDDGGTALLLAMTMAREGKQEAAVTHFNNAIRNTIGTPNNSTFADDVLAYSLTHNLAAILKHMGNPTGAETAWKKLAQQAKSNGDGLLFQVVLDKMGTTKPGTNDPYPANVANYQLGQQYTRPENQAIVSDDLWLEGTRYQVLRIEQNIKLIINNKDRIISATQIANPLIKKPANRSTNNAIPTSTTGNVANTINQDIQIDDAADRPIKRFGLPSRRIHLMSGDYLAYDHLGIAFHTLNGRIAGWFLYDPV